MAKNGFVFPKVTSILKIYGEQELISFYHQVQSKKPHIFLILFDQYMLEKWKSLFYQAWYPFPLPNKNQNVWEKFPAIRYTVIKWESFRRFQLIHKMKYNCCWTNQNVSSDTKFYFLFYIKREGVVKPPEFSSSNYLSKIEVAH